MPHFNRKASATEEWQMKSTDNLDNGKRLRSEVSALLDIAKN